MLCYEKQIDGTYINLSKRFRMYIPMYHMFLLFRMVFGQCTSTHGYVEEYYQNRLRREVIVYNVCFKNHIDNYTHDQMTSFSKNYDI